MNVGTFMCDFVLQYVKKKSPSHSASMWMCPDSVKTFFVFSSFTSGVSNSWLGGHLRPTSLAAHILMWRNIMQFEGTSYVWEDLFVVECDAKISSIKSQKWFNMSRAPTRWGIGCVSSVRVTNSCVHFFTLLHTNKMTAEVPPRVWTDREERCVCLVSERFQLRVRNKCEVCSFVLLNNIWNIV